MKTTLRNYNSENIINLFGSLLLAETKVRKHSFSENFQNKKIVFLIFLFPLKDLTWEYLVVSKFLSEVPKFKENVLICVIIVIKVRDLLFTLLQIMAILVA